MLITKEVLVTLSGENIKWFENKGYEIPRRVDKQGRINVKKGTKLLVKVEDLSDNSDELVNVQCDISGEIFENIKWKSYLSNIKSNQGKYIYKDTSYNSRSGKIRSPIKCLSFYDWCYENLSKEDADKLLSRWYYEKNVDKYGNILSPKDVSRGSDGLKRKGKRGYYFKCLDHPEHEPEIKNICRFTNNFKGYMGSIECVQCNCLAITHHHLVRYFINKDDANKYSFGSNESILMKCPDCGFERKKKITDLATKGFSCKICSDQISYSEKFLANLLRQVLDQVFITQLSKTTFKWCEKFKYDFYIDKINGIICETMGSQHYKQSTGNWGSLETIQENDLNKEWLARENKIKNYIVIDCRKSELEWVKNSIMKSRLPMLLGFKENDVDWLKCHEYACNSNLVKEVCELWNSGIKNQIEISEKIQIGKSTVWKYLNIGTELGWCDAIKKHKIISN